MLSPLGHNTLIQLIGKLLATLAGLVVVAFMTRSLGPTGFGHYTTIIVFLQTFAILIDFGLTMTAGRSLGEHKIPSHIFLSNLLSFRVITAAMTFALAPTVALFLPYPGIVKLGITATSLAFFLASLTQSFQAVFQASLKSGYLVAADLAGKLLLLVGTILVAQLNLGLMAFLAVYTVSSAAIAGGTLFYARKLMPFKWELDLLVWKTIWLATWPIAITIGLNLIYLKTDTLILAATWPAHDVGLYGVAYKVLEVLLAVPAIIGGLVLPLAARYLALADKTSLKQLFNDSFDTLLAAGAAIIAGGIIVGTPIIILLAGGDFAVAGQLLMPLSLATALIFIGNVTGYFIFALGKQRQIIPLYIMVAITALILYFILIPRYSYWGAAWGTVTVEALMAVVSLILLKRWGLVPSVARWPKILLATAILIIGLLLPLPLILKILVAGLMYGVTVWYLKLIPLQKSL